MQHRWRKPGSLTCTTSNRCRGICDRGTPRPPAEHAHRAVSTRHSRRLCPARHSGTRCKPTQLRGMDLTFQGRRASADLPQRTASCAQFSATAWSTPPREEILPPTRSHIARPRPSTQIFHGTHDDPSLKVHSFLPTAAFHALCGTTPTSLGFVGEWIVVFKRWPRWQGLPRRPV